ncbi:hypothetical protein SAMN05216456_1331 [Devosia crocina]|uniref:Uncharacterized protein n=1 Tax=Devosia crocina TaxID=429728 RepID=A0A1I7N9Q7_9HYPH|nr:hypothetical protein [Devosia crocina]SFV31407.1 hypothetical protein SAMN05216456_1331 [Devosia crocina]
MARLPQIAKPELAADWQAVLRHAWSIRLMAVAALLSFLEVVLPLIGGHLPFPPVVTALLIGLATAGAFVARLVAQKDLKGDRDE